MKSSKGKILSGRAQSSDHSHAVRKRPLHVHAAVTLIVVLAIGAMASLDWNLSALFSTEERAQAFERLTRFLSAFTSPDFSSEFVARAFRLTLVTASIAILGSLLGTILGYLLALGASRTVMLGLDPPQNLRQARSRGSKIFISYAIRRGILESFRLILDTLRGVPDFAWALLILTIPGPGAVTGVLALGANMAGILGKIYSELWDAIEPTRVEAVQGVGGGRLATLFYSVQPLASRSMLSYTLMRTECSMRNASVLGAVGGGGLGLAMFDEFNFGNYSGMVTLLIFMLGLTASADALANFIRYQLKSDSNHPRVAKGARLRDALRRRLTMFICLSGVIVASIYGVRESVTRALREMRRIEWDFIAREFGRFLNPDLSLSVVGDALASCRIPLAMAFLSTSIGFLGAVCLAYTSSIAFQVESHRFTGERIRLASRLISSAQVFLSRTIALFFRAVPEVVWVWIFAAFFRIGTLPGLIAMSLHSAGVLGRVFTESADNCSYPWFERVYRGRKRSTFLYAVLPLCRRDWITYSVFQFESNVRMGVILGILGIGGLGDSFHTAFSMRWALEEASTYLLAMVGLTLAIDRISRWMKVSRVSLSNSK